MRERTAELWKDVVGYEKYYMVSTKGRVKKYIPNKRNGLLEASFILREKRVNGYINVDFREGKGRKLVHRVVAEAFIPNLKNKPYVNHIDNNGFNNTLGNLEWVTPEENSHHYRGTETRIAGSDYKSTILNDIQENYVPYSSYRGTTYFANKYDLTQRQIIRYVAEADLSGEILDTSKKWVDVKGYEGLYKISEDGKVVALPRKSMKSNSGWTKQRHLKQREVLGFWVVNLKGVDGHYRSYRVYTIMMSSFYNIEFPRHQTIEFKDGDNTNYKITNMKVLNRNTKNELEFKDYSDMQKYRITFGKEEWYEYPYDSKYFISSHGKIVNRNTNKQISARTKSGDTFVTLYLKGTYPVPLKKVLADTFLIEPTWSGERQIRFKDGNKDNVYVHNLYYAPLNSNY